MDITSRATSAVDIATRALSQLYQLGERWKSAPREVTQLRETVASFCRLLESIEHARAALAIESPGQLRTTQGLVKELESASKTLSELMDIVAQVHPLPVSPVQEAEAAVRPASRGTWSVQRRRAMQLVHDLNNQHQRILAIWSLLNMCDTNHFRSSRDPEHD